MNRKYRKLILRIVLSVLFVTGMGASPFSCLEKKSASSVVAPVDSAASAASTGVSGTCNRVSLASNCSEYLNESVASLAVYQGECLSPNTWSSGLNCPSSGVVGICTMDADAGDSEIFYSTASTVEHSGWTITTGSGAGG